MMIELSPMLLANLDRAIELHGRSVREDDFEKAKPIMEAWRKEMAMLMSGLSRAVEGQREAAGE